ncbi:Excreted virulence factor EspC, type VII ESX diderm [Amycolatopsis arida]|uniref:Excreted virulence factor EspC, type VII ESX diderm n=1 Tax=Amycolatopsis arida TaxID=587909 RepID=A0A1I5PEY6_9PSEU|nr:type VII secretion target [Amycolatopsis arida]TDX98474.1 excreted virulence factor EspC (type VII ESX diderm) [Amycolatopsis arida]SFP32605.1 Excreted virulence factor EspC, type VII ESX diderm [Amycolatopsis arida]
MGNGQGFEILEDELRTHAGKVEGLAERLRTAVQAAQQVTMDNSAYGVICQPFALLLDPFEQMGVRVLRQGAESVGDGAGKVRDAATEYAAREDDTAAAITKTGGAP